MDCDRRNVKERRVKIFIYVSIYIYTYNIVVY